MRGEVRLRHIRALPATVRGAVAGAALVAALTIAAVAANTARALPAGDMQQTESFSVHLPLAMRRGLLEDIPTVRPVLATATPVATITPSATASEALPSPTPTDQPPPTTDVPPTPSPTPSATPGGLGCKDLIQNGGFESGPVSWSMTINGDRQPPSDAIEPRDQSAVPPRTGEWAAWLGGLLQGLSVLESTGLLTYEPGQIVSGTLEYHVALITEELPNRRANDWVRARLDGERRNLRVEGASRSDEDFTAQRVWHKVTADITDYLATDEVRHLSLEVENDMLARSWFYFDDVVVRACWDMP